MEQQGEFESLLTFQEMDGELSGNYKLVPWINWEEWNLVRDNLFSSLPDSVSAAVKRISAWKSRGSLPVVVEATACIIEIQHKDPFFREGLDENASVSEELLAMLYSMGIMRLVNGVVDQDRNKTKASIAQEAERIGLPRMLVDLRHESAHRDLPSVKLLRVASVVAVNWIKSYYWEPQKDYILLPREQIANARKQVKSKLRVLAHCLNLKQTSQSGALPVKRKRTTQPEGIYSHKKFCLHKAGMIQGSNSQGPKGQIKKTFKRLVRLYFDFPSDVVGVLVEFLIKALNSSDTNEVVSSDISGEEHISQNSKTRTIGIWKHIISRLSSKVPALIPIMLNELLDMIESLESVKSVHGRVHFSWSGHKVKVCQVERLSSLVVWLIGKYNPVKHSSQMVCGDEMQESSEKTNATKVTLKELLKKCLLVFSPGNNQLAEAAVLLGQIIGNDSTAVKVKKISLFSFRKLDNVEEISTQTNGCSYPEQESSITQAQEWLESLKRRRQNKGKAETILLTDGDLEQKENRWRWAKSYKQCPLGKLPGAHCAGDAPILDKALNLTEAQPALEVDGLEPIEESNATKKSRMMVDDGPGDDKDSPEPFIGRLLIDGVWKKVREEDLMAIEPAVRILV